MFPPCSMLMRLKRAIEVKSPELIKITDRGLLLSQAQTTNQFSYKFWSIRDTARTVLHPNRICFISIYKPDLKRRLWETVCSLLRRQIPKVFSLYLCEKCGKMVHIWVNNGPLEYKKNVCKFNWENLRKSVLDTMPHNACGARSQWY